jgi:plastocyanin
MESIVNRILTRITSLGVAITMAGVTTNAAFATEWRAWVGAQSPDLGSQALAFLPSEIWIHAGDSIRWMHSTTEIHTVTFLMPGQTRPPNFGPVFGIPVGCPGNTPDGASFDGSSCVNSGILGEDQNTGTDLERYSVSFPTPGNFKLVCLVHADMTGTVHVLKPSETLPHDQTFYDIQTAKEGAALVAAASSLGGLPNAEDEGHVSAVTAGVGAIVTTTGAGSQTVSLSRFLQRVIVVRVGTRWNGQTMTHRYLIRLHLELSRPTHAVLLPM